MYLVDSHCHLDSLNYDSLHTDINDVVAKAKQRDVQHLLSVCVTLDGFERTAALVGNHPDVSLSCGIHPSDIIADEPFDRARMLELCQHPKVIAVGEIGLDYHYNPQERWHEQCEYFSQQIDIANQIDKPIIVHTRDAHADTLDLLSNNRADKCGGIIHCFTENQAFADKALDLGFYISFSGIVTFKNAEDLRQVLLTVPLDRLLLETDSPFLAPVPFRGKENQPAYVRDTCEFVAKLKGIEAEELAAITTANFERLFKLELVK